MHQATLPFGTLSDGRCANLYLLSNDSGMTVGVSDLGADLVLVRVPDRHGNRPDVLLGYDSAAGYKVNGPDFGAIVGRCANRIAQASFKLNGVSYHLTANEGPNNLHSGPHMYFQRLWTHRVQASNDSVAFELTSEPNDQGFPGSLKIAVNYRLDESNALEISYDAQPSEATIVNLTCHAYWNLNGHASGSALGHTLMLDSDSYTPPNEENIPTGEIRKVDGSVFDFRKKRSLASGLGARYDHNFLLAGAYEHRLQHAARLEGDLSGIALDISTDAPGLQLYTSEYLDVARGKDGVAYGKGAGVAIETQFPPDAIHHKNFPQPIFTPEHPFHSKTIFSFSQN